jgi:hypothetical protein
MSSDDLAPHVRAYAWPGDSAETAALIAKADAAPGPAFRTFGPDATGVEGVWVVVAGPDAPDAARHEAERRVAIATARERETIDAVLGDPTPGLTLEARVARASEIEAAKGVPDRLADVHPSYEAFRGAHPGWRDRLTEIENVEARRIAAAVAEELAPYLDAELATIAGDPEGRRAAPAGLAGQIEDAAFRVGIRSDVLNAIPGGPEDPDARALSEVFHPAIRGRLHAHLVEWLANRADPRWPGPWGRIIWDRRDPVIAAPILFDEIRGALDPSRADLLEHLRWVQGTRYGSKKSIEGDRPTRVEVDGRSRAAAIRAHADRDRALEKRFARVGTPETESSPPTEVRLADLDAKTGEAIESMAPDPRVLDAITRVDDSTLPPDEQLERTQHKALLRALITAVTADDTDVVKSALLVEVMRLDPVGVAQAIVEQVRDLDGLKRGDDRVYAAARLLALDPADARCLATDYRSATGDDREFTEGDAKRVEYHLKKLRANRA